MFKKTLVFIACGSMLGNAYSHSVEITDDQKKEIIRSYKSVHGDVKTFGSITALFATPGAVAGLFLVASLFLNDQVEPVINTKFASNICIGSFIFALSPLLICMMTVLKKREKEKAISYLGMENEPELQEYLK